MKRDEILARVEDLYFSMTPNDMLAFLVTRALSEDDAEKLVAHLEREVKLINDARKDEDEDPRQEKMF